jgi:lipopolysaccharide cholinephosphotransferase
MKTYSDETLCHVQRCELIILRDFISICEQNNLRYFGLAGTGIGALRHRGFIPWDDDIDVGLPAQDHDRLLEIVRHDYSDKYEVMNSADNLDYPFATTRIMLKGTQFCEEVLADFPLDLGIFLDVYSFDSVPDDEGAYRRQAWDAWFWTHIRMLISIPNPVILVSGWRGSIIRGACRFAHSILRLFGVSRERIYRRETEARHRYAGQETKRIAYLCDTDRFSQTYAWDDLLPLQKLPFEDVEMCFSANLDADLREMFGDYMQMPPENKRKNHYPARLNFGPY